MTAAATGRAVRDDARTQEKETVVTGDTAVPSTFCDLLISLSQLYWEVYYCLNSLKEQTQAEIETPPKAKTLGGMSCDCDPVVWLRAHTGNSAKI